MYPHNLVLIGFMGAGKSTVGQVLAAMTGYAYWDIDHAIERQAGKPVAAIFADHGEHYFRSLERDEIKKYSCQVPSVISCGGGAVLDASNVAALKQTGRLIWLQAEPETIYDRIREQNTRPLAQNKDIHDIKRLIADRLPIYEAAADCRIVTDGKTAAEISAEILNTVFPGLYQRPEV